jgi:hypothetical protein
MDKISHIKNIEKFIPFIYHHSVHSVYILRRRKKVFLVQLAHKFFSGGLKFYIKWIHTKQCEMYLENFFSSFFTMWITRKRQQNNRFFLPLLACLPSFLLRQWMKMSFWKGTKRGCKKGKEIFSFIFSLDDVEEKGVWCILEGVVEVFGVDTRGRS